LIACSVSATSWVAAAGYTTLASQALELMFPLEASAAPWDTGGVPLLAGPVAGVPCRGTEGFLGEGQGGGLGGGASGWGTVTCDVRATVVLAPAAFVSCDGHSDGAGGQKGGHRGAPVAGVSERQVSSPGSTNRQPVPACPSPAARPRNVSH